MFDWRKWFARTTAIPGSRQAEEEERYQASTARFWEEEYPKVKAKLILDLYVDGSNIHAGGHDTLYLIDATQENGDHG